MNNYWYQEIWNRLHVHPAHDRFVRNIVALYSQGPSNFYPDKMKGECGGGEAWWNLLLLNKHFSINPDFEKCLVKTLSIDDACKCVEALDDPEAELKVNIWKFRITEPVEL